MHKGREGTSGWGWGSAFAASSGPRFYVEFDGDSSYIDCGSDSTLDDIPHGTSFTLDAWMKAAQMTDALGEDVQPVVGKEYVGGGYWFFELYRDTEVPADYINARIGSDAAIPASLSPISSAVYAEWTHLAMVYDDLDDRKIYFAVNGIWVPGYTVQTAGTGTLITEAASSLFIGYLEPSYLEGDISWLRISSGLRWTPSVSFTPPERCKPPAVDGSTIELWTMDEGVGMVAAASVVSPNNDGAMTGCAWHAC